MKPKQMTVCHTCRAHKIGCDGKLPTCTQCRFTGRRCGGYKLDMVFVPYSTKPPRKSSKNTLFTKNSPNSYQAPRPIGFNITRKGSQRIRQFQLPNPINPTAPNDFTAIIVDRFIPEYQHNLPSFDTSTSQICGAWVEVLPSLVARAHPGELITVATKAFGMAILAINSRTIDGSFDSIEAYSISLQKLKGALYSRESFFSIETAAAIVCLAMVELMLPTSETNSLAHFGGLGALINTFSPELFSSDHFHAIFVGCRPVLLFEALDSRKSTFLCEEKWMITPFRHHPPSDIQILVGNSAILPSILEEIDSLQTLPQDAAVRKAYKAKNMLFEVFERLSKWNDRFPRVTKSRLQLLQRNWIADTLDDGESNFWFPNLLAANVHTHMWAFQIICLTELEKLTSFLRDCNGSRTFEAVGSEQGSIIRATAFATKICQCMEYLLQDEMKLYGPASAIFPLKTAYNVLVGDKQGNKDQIDRCRKYRDRIRERGFLSASM